MTKAYYFSAACFAVFLVNLLLVKSRLQLPEFFTSYLNDLLCLPVVLGICLLVIRKFSKNKQLQISLFSVFSLAALYSVYFEIYLPEVTERYTADVFDVFLYFVGALLFYLFQKPNEKQEAHCRNKTT